MYKGNKSKGMGLAKMPQNFYLTTQGRGKDKSTFPFIFDIVYR